MDKKIGIGIGVLLITIVTINLAINLWIRHSLPNYLRENTDYTINYDELQIDLLTGNISFTNISVKNKLPNNYKIPNIQANAKKLKIENIGVINFIINQQIDISSILLVNPQCKIVLPKENSNTLSKKRNIEVKNIYIENGNIDIYKSDDSNFFSVKNFYLSIEDIIFEKNTGSPFPFRFGAINTRGQSIFFENEKYKTSAKYFAIDNKKIHLNEFKTESYHQKISMQDAHLQINSQKLEREKIGLDIENAVINNLDLKWIKKNKINKKEGKKINLDILIKKFAIKNSSVHYIADKSPFLVKKFDANLNNITINLNNNTQKDSFSIEKYLIIADNIEYGDSFYDYSLRKVDFNERKIVAMDFHMKPKFSKAKFVKIIPTERDLYDIKFKEVFLHGKWNFFSENPYLEASKLSINNIVAKIFRSKIPADNTDIKPLYSELLRKVKLPFYIANTHINNSLLIYEEDTHKSNGAGKLTFNELSVKILHLNSGKIKNKPTQISIGIDCKLFNISPMKVKWIMDTQNTNDNFQISGGIYALPASAINPFVEPYLKIKTTGYIQQMNFDFKGNTGQIGGNLTMKHKDMKVSVLNDEGKKRKFLSAVANMFVKNNSNQFPETVKITNIQRDKTKSFFNLFWKGIESGLVKILIGESAENIRQDMKK